MINTVMVFNDDIDRFEILVEVFCENEFYHVVGFMKWRSDRFVNIVVLSGGIDFLGRNLKWIIQSVDFIFDGWLDRCWTHSVSKNVQFTEPRSQISQIPDASGCNVLPFGGYLFNLFDYFFLVGLPESLRKIFVEKAAIKVEPKCFCRVFLLNRKRLYAVGQSLEKVNHFTGLFSQLPVINVNAWQFSLN
jgi:hypothetical protein